MVTVPATIPLPSRDRSIPPELKRCASCKLVLNRQRRFVLRRADDPYGIATAKKRKRRPPNPALSRFRGCTFRRHVADGKHAGDYSLAVSSCGTTALATGPRGTAAYPRDGSLTAIMVLVGGWRHAAPRYFVFDRLTPEVGSIAGVTSVISVGANAADAVTVDTDAEVNRKVLDVRPHCRDCERDIRRRAQSARQLCAQYDLDYDESVANKDREGWSFFDAIEVPDGHPALDHAEEFARAGLTPLDKDGDPYLPSDPETALRLVYASLTSDHVPNPAQPDRRRPVRLGWLKEREVYLQAIPALVEKLGVEHPLVSYKARGGAWGRAQDVVDAALVREGLGRASAALQSVVDRYSAHHAKVIRSAVDQGRYGTTNVRDGLAYAREEAHARALKGFLDGTVKWNPLHESGSALSTRLRPWIRRRLEVRSRVEAPIGCVKDAKGNWVHPAASLDALGAAHRSEDTYVPHVARAQDGGVSQNPWAQAADAEGTKVAALDVQRVLATLPVIDSTLATRHLIDNESITTLADEMDMPRSEVKDRLEEVREFLTSALSAYAAA